MYRITLIIAIALVTMAFAQPGKEKGKSSNSGEKSVSHAPKSEKVSNSGGGNDFKKNEGGSFDQGKKGHQEKNGGGKNHGMTSNPGKQGNGDVKKKSGHGNMGGNSHPMQQPNKGKGEKGHNGGGKHFDQKNHHQGNRNVGYPKGFKGKGGKMHYEKGHPNFAYVFVNTHGYYSHKNYGQWRSQQAKKKHKHYHPVYEYEAREGFSLLVTRNGFLFSETMYKINLINTQLVKKREANQITVVQYNTYVSRIAVLQKRRAALEINIVL